MTTLFHVAIVLLITAFYAFFGGPFVVGFIEGITGKKFWQVLDDIKNFPHGSGL